MISVPGESESVLQRSQLETVTIGASASIAPRFEWLDGLRAYAILGVIFVHAALRIRVDDHASGATIWFKRIAELGQYGVQLFFVISAITVFYTLGRFDFHPAEFGGWLIKRYFRIAPLYYIAIAGYLVLDLLGNFVRSHHHKVILPIFTPADAIANILFIHTWIPHANNNVVPGGWSIGVEMMFYVIAPLCFFVVKRRGGPYFASILAILSVGISLLLAHGNVVNNTYFYYWFPSQLPVILCGLVLCQICRSWIFTEKPNPRGATAVSRIVSPIAFVLAACCGGLLNWSNAFAPLLFGISFSGVAILARDPLRSAFIHPMVVWLGRLSYSIYIIHFAVMNFIDMAELKLPILKSIPDILALPLIALVTLGLTIPFAVLLRRAVEEPGIRLGRKLSSAIVNS